MPSTQRISWNIANGKVLHIGIEKNGREHRWKVSPNSQGKAEIFREIADVLDPPPRSASQRRRRTAEDEYYDDDGEEWDQPRRSRPRRPQEPPRQVRTPYPPLDPEADPRARQRPAVELVEHSRGYLPDGTPITTPLPEDPDEAESVARLSREAYEKARAHPRAALEGEGATVDLPIIEARPMAQRKSTPLDSAGRSFLPPPAHQELGEGQKVRKRPKITDPDFYYRDTR